MPHREHRRVDLLPNGTPEQVEEAFAGYRDAAAGGGYILCDSNSLHRGSTLWNASRCFKRVKDGARRP